MREFFNRLFYTLLMQIQKKFNVKNRVSLTYPVKKYKKMDFFLLKQEKYSKKTRHTLLEQEEI